MASGTSARKNHHNTFWVIFAITIALCVVAYLYWKYQVPFDRAQVEFQESDVSGNGDLFEGERIGGELFQETIESVRDAIPDVQPSF